MYSLGKLDYGCICTIESAAPFSQHVNMLTVIKMHVCMLWFVNEHDVSYKHFDLIMDQRLRDNQNNYSSSESMFVPNSMAGHLSVDISLKSINLNLRNVYTKLEQCV